MDSYLFEICKEDGSTPLGRCPVFEVFTTDFDQRAARSYIMKTNPGHDVVSWGLRSEIENRRKRDSLTPLKKTPYSGECFPKDY